MSTNDDGIEYVYTRFITRNGKRIYHPKGGLYKFPKRSKKSKSQIKLTELMAFKILSNCSLPSFFRGAGYQINLYFERATHEFAK